MKIASYALVTYACMKNEKSMWHEQCTMQEAGICKIKFKIKNYGSNKQEGKKYRSRCHHLFSLH